MKSLLIITDQFTVGGLETHIRGEIDFFVKQGYLVHLLVTGRVSFDLIPPTVNSVTVIDPIDVSFGRLLFVQTVERIREIIREKNINIVHSHPFFSIIYGFIAAEMEAIPFLMTLHGPSSLDSYGVFYDCLYKSIVLKESGLIVTVSQEIAERAIVYAPAEKVFILNNSVDFVNFEGVQSSYDVGIDNRWLIISRLDQFKVPGIFSAIKLLWEAGALGVVVAGDGDAADQLKSDLSRAGLSQFATFIGAISDASSHIARHAGVAGMGRVVLEGVASRKPTILVGYDGVKGLIDTELFMAAVAANFSGRKLENISVDELIAQLEQNAHNLCELDDVFQAARIICDASVNWRFLEAKLERLKPANTVVSEIYEKLKNGAIDVSGAVFDSDLLLNELNGLLNIQTEQYLKTVWGGVGVMNKKLSGNIQTEYDPRERRIVELEFDLANKTADNQPIIDKLDDLKIEFDRLNSRFKTMEEAFLQKLDGFNKDFQHIDKQITYGSSRIESSFKNIVSDFHQKPSLVNDSETSNKRSIFRSSARIVKRIFTSLFSKSERYQLLKDIYWQLPSPLRKKLNGFRNKFVQSRLRVGLDVTEDNAFGSMQTPEWVEWLSEFDKVAIVTCGFEFDELVNQRPINLAKYLSSAGYGVIFVAWQWNADEILQKGTSVVFDNVYQVPLFSFFNGVEALPLRKATSHYIISLPASGLYNQISKVRTKGFTIIYDIMDEWEEFSKVGQAPWYDKVVENALIRESDRVFCVAPALKDKFSYIREDIQISANGFTPAVIGLDARGIVEAHTENKVIGYFGHLTDSWFDWPLVFELAKSFPEVEFQIIGYGSPDWVNRKVAKFPNIKLLGKVHPSKLKEYVINWTHGIIPFREGKLSRAVDPIKIYEYIYFGLPTIVTGIAHLDTYPLTKWFSRNEVAENFHEFLVEAHDKGQLVDVFLSESTWSARFDRLISESEKHSILGDLYV